MFPENIFELKLLKVETRNNFRNFLQYLTIFTVRRITQIFWDVLFLCVDFT